MEAEAPSGACIDNSPSAATLRLPFLQGVGGVGNALGAGDNDPALLFIRYTDLVHCGAGATAR